MHSAFIEANCNWAGLEAVHCAISAGDALLAYTSGIRSVSSDHGDVVYLLRTHVRDPDVGRNVSRLQAILVQKGDIE